MTKRNDFSMELKRYAKSTEFSSVMVPTELLLEAGITLGYLRSHSLFELMKEVNVILKDHKTTGQHSYDDEISKALIAVRDALMNSEVWGTTVKHVYPYLAIAERILKDLLPSQRSNLVSQDIPVGEQYPSQQGTWHSDQTSGATGVSAGIRLEKFGKIKEKP